MEVDTYMIQAAPQRGSGGCMGAVGVFLFVLFLFWILWSFSGSTWFQQPTTACSSIPTPEKVEWVYGGRPEVQNSSRSPTLPEVQNSSRSPTLPEERPTRKKVTDLTEDTFGEEDLSSNLRHMHNSSPPGGDDCSVFAAAPLSWSI